MSSNQSISFEELQFLYRSFELALGIPVILFESLIIFIILGHSPQEMKVYSRLLLNETICELVTVFFISVIWQPVPLLPFPGVVAAGPSALFGKIGNIIAAVITIQLYGQCLVSVTACFVYRYHKVTGEGKGQVRIWRTMIALLAVWYICDAIVVITGIMAFTSYDDVDANLLLQTLISTRPEWSSLKTRNVMVYPANACIVISAALAMLLLVFNCMLGILLFHLIKRQLKEKQSTISGKTFKMHRNLTLGLLIQVLAPIVCILVPLVVNSFLAALQAGNAVASAFTLNAMIYYHLFSGAATLYFVKPYAKALRDYNNGFLSLFRCGKQKVSKTQISPLVGTAP